MSELLSALWELIKNHWHQILISLVSIFAGAWIGRRRAKREWARKEFLDRINFSLRTLIEKNTHDVFLNKVAAEEIAEAASKTDAKSSLLPVKPENRWYFLNAVLNELSEKFAEGFMLREMGLPVRAAQFLVCLTYESAGDLKTRKIRVMIIRKDLLTALPADPPNFERPHHKTRWQTLQQLAASYAAEPDQFMEVELILPGN
jgi:transcriptional regulator with XRE-family HTH domain